MCLFFGVKRRRCADPENLKWLYLPLFPSFFVPGGGVPITKINNGCVCVCFFCIFFSGQGGFRVLSRASSADGGIGGGKPRSRRGWETLTDCRRKDGWGQVSHTNEWKYLKIQTNKSKSKTEKQKNRKVVDKKKWDEGQKGKKTNWKKLTKTYIFIINRNIADEKVGLRRTRADTFWHSKT